ncbi:hypothetical protein LH425_13900, partial [Laribacter hongkongensis]
HSQSRQLENPSRPQNGYRLSLDGAAQRACLDGYSLAYFLIDALDTARHHLPVPFNSGTGIGVPNILADSRHFAAFFASVTYAIGASMVSMVGRSGGVLARAGFQDAGTPTLLRACHPDWRRDGGFNTHLGGHHA